MSPSDNDVFKSYTVLCNFTRGIVQSYSNTCWYVNLKSKTVSDKNRKTRLKETVSIGSVCVPACSILVVASASAMG